MLAQWRRDPVMGPQLALWSGVAALNAGVIAGLAATLAARPGAASLGLAGSRILLAILLWFSISGFLLFGKARERCTPFELALPLSARRLWLSHVLVVTAGGLLFVALMAAVMGILFRAFEGTAVDFSMLEQAMAGLMLPIVACLILVVVVVQSMQPSLYRMRRTGKCSLLSILIVVAAFGLVLLLSVLPPVATLAPLALAAWFGWRTCRVLPQAFQWTALEPDSAGAGWAAPQAGVVPEPAAALAWESDGGSGPGKSISLPWFLLRLAYTRPAMKAAATVFFFPLFFTWGFLASGLLSVWKGLEIPQFSYVVLTGYLLFSILPTQMSYLHVVDILPISRRHLCAILLLPSLLCLAAGVGAGRIGVSLLEVSKLQLQYGEPRSGYFPPYASKIPLIRVPPQYCEIAWDGQPAQSVAPWGESHPVWSHSLVRGSRISIYSPFSTPDVSSPQFVAYQIGKALQAIYGESVPDAVILDRYLEADGKGGVKLKDAGQQLLENYPNRRGQHPVPMFPVFMLLVSVIWMLMASIYFRACRASVTDRGRWVAFFGMLAAAMGFTIAQVGIMVAGLVRPDNVGAFFWILMRELVAALPGGSVTVWIICALLVLGAYRMARMQFERVEVLPGRQKM